MTIRTRRGRQKGTPSPGRSEKLKGRPSPRKGVPNQPRASQLQGQGRPLRFICVNCCKKYDRKSIEYLLDHRQTKGTNKGNQLDEWS